MTLTTILFCVLLQVSALINFPLEYQNSTSELKGAYKAVLSVKTTNQNLSFAIDTASSWVIISRNSLSPLFTPEYCLNTSKASYFRGKKITGKVCSVTMNIGSSPKNVKFLYTDTKFKGFDGVVGLASSRLSNGQLPLIQQIGESVFSIYLSDLQSYLTIGGFSDEYGEGESWFIKSYPHSGEWELPLSHILFNNQASKVLLYAALDSNSKYLEFTNETFIFILKQLKEVVDYSCEAGIFFNRSQYNMSNFPNITLQIDKVDYVMQHSDFIECENDTCQILVKKNERNKTIFGLPFFKKYYLVFDLDRYGVGVYVSRKNIENGVIYTIYIIGLVVFGVILSIPVCFLFMLSKIRGIIDVNSTDYNPI